MPQTTQLNEYTKEELNILCDLAYENGHFALSDKLSDDYTFLLDMEKKKEEECSHPRDKRVYVGRGMLRCTLCDEEFS